MLLVRPKKENRIEITKEFVDTGIIEDIKTIVNFLYPDNEVRACIHIGNILLLGGIKKRDLINYVNISSTAVYKNREANRDNLAEVEEMVSKMIKLKRKINGKL